VSKIAEDYRAKIRDALDAGDHRDAHDWAKGWIGNGGAQSVEPWLVYVVGAIHEGQRKGATHPVDLALQFWIEDPRARAVLHYVRGEIVRHRASDPKTALADLEAAASDAPDWLREDASRAVEECAAEAEKSRKRKPTVDPAPDYEGDNGTEVEPTAKTDRRVDEPPAFWDDLLGSF
jgi:hypothetical protein